MLQSLDRGLAVMEYLSCHSSVSVSEVAAVFDITKSTASRILSTLEDHHMVEQNENTKRFHLGYGLWMLSSELLNENVYIEKLHPVLRQLSERVDEAACLCVWRDKEAYLFDQISKKYHAGNRSEMQPGYKVSLTRGAIGKLMMAYRPVEEQRLILSRISTEEQMPSNHIEIESEINQLRLIKRNNYALEQEVIRKPTFSLAVPIKGEGGCVKMGLGLHSARKLEVGSEVTNLYLALMQETAWKMSRLIV